MSATICGDIGCADICIICSGRLPFISSKVQPVMRVNPSLAHSMQPALSMMMTPLLVREATRASFRASASLARRTASTCSRRVWARTWKKTITAAAAPAGTPTWSAVSTPPRHSVKSSCE